MQAHQGGEVDLGGGRRALCEAGHLRVAGPPEGVPDPVELVVPGAARFGTWELRAERIDTDPAEDLRSADPDVALLDAEAAGARLTVRAWRDGDRMRPLGLDGTKSLQDLFTDRRVPRSLRRSLPVVAGADERILWVAGVAISEEAKVGEATRSAVRLHAAAYTGPR
jgi:tRNA(Ile)-lysidine synthase